ncbi:unnamed protein product [Adineta steineri]|uniref:Uncharacterized protein n=1 Tax=Adineta steineri TaxID=433720 RepID=A0A815NAQ1_9BILA|nr:unnamed protein product [Adineta steineri]CAF3986364.1 unnamed protein product [Adineta steineri]
MAEPAHSVDKPYIDQIITKPHTSEFFPGTAAKTAETLLSSFKEILKTAKRSIEREPYQIKIFWNNNSMRLRYDALTWFDYILPSGKRTCDAHAEIGSKYVSECLTVEHEKDVRERAMNSRDRYFDKVRRWYTLPRHSYDCGKVHVLKECNKKITFISGSRDECKQFFDDRTYIASVCIDNKCFMLHSRPESTRDILLFPVDHMDNEEFITMSSTWKAIIEVEKRLKDVLSLICPTQTTESPIESVYFNFGSWMTAMTKNQLAKTAHAHVHLLLTANTISTLSPDINLSNFGFSDTLYVLNLSGCFRDPIDYEYSDAVIL